MVPALPACLKQVYIFGLVKGKPSGANLFLQVQATWAAEQRGLYLVALLTGATRIVSLVAIVDI